MYDVYWCPWLLCLFVSLIVEWLKFLFVDSSARFFWKDLFIGCSVQYCLFCFEQFCWDLIRTCGFATCCLYRLITYSEFIGTEPGPVDPWTHLNAAEMKCCQIYLSCMLCCCCCVCVTELDKSRLLLQRPGCRWVGTSHTHVLLRHIADCFLDALHLLLSRRPVSLHDCLSQSFCSNLTDSISWMQPD